MLVRVLRTYPDLPEAKEIRAVLADHLTAENLKAEADYFNRKEAKSFERPYGWAWLLKLAEELHTWDDPDAKKWSANLKPLADLIAARYVEFFPKQTYPIRTGVHSNTAFGLTFAHDYAKAVGNKKLQELIEERAKAYFAQGRRRPGPVGAGRGRLLLAEPVEADLMRRVLPPAEFRDVVPQVPARRGEGRADDALRAGDGDRPHRPAARPPRRAEPEPGVVHARHR